MTELPQERGRRNKLGRKAPYTLSFPADGPRRFLISFVNSPAADLALVTLSPFTVENPPSKVVFGGLEEQHPNGEEVKSLLLNLHNMTNDLHHLWPIALN